MKTVALAALLLAALSLVTVAASALPVASPADTIVVISVADSGPGSLRQALLDAQGGDTITFNPAVFPPGAPATIFVDSELPCINANNLTLDASNAGVILDGTNVPRIWVGGLDIVSNGNTVQGLQVSYFSGAGMAIGGAYNAIGGDRGVGAAPLGAVYASSESLPGDSLYPVKLAGERIRLALSPSDAAEAPLHLRLAGERLHEAARLSERGREDDVETLMSRYVERVEAASRILQSQHAKGRDVTLLSRGLREHLAQHQVVLSGIQEGVSAGTEAAVGRAMAASEAAEKQAMATMEEEPPASPTTQPTSTHTATVTASANPTPSGIPRATETPEPTYTYTPTGTSEPAEGLAPTDTPGSPGRTKTPQPPGQTKTPQPPGQTNTPQPPGQTKTPQPPGQTKTPQPPGQTNTPQPPGRTKSPQPPGLGETSEPPRQARTATAP